MFLATTGLREFWETNQPILFLGSGCLRYEERKEWESLPYQILPCLWDDREEFYQATAYLERTYEFLLERLGVYLNQIHEMNFPPLGWRILVGPWLMQYLHVLYDRRAHLQRALALYPDLQTVVLARSAFRVPLDHLQASDWLAADAYNLQIVSQILQFLGHRFPEKPLPKQAATASGKHRGQDWTRTMRQLLAALLYRPDRVAVCELYLPRRIVWPLIWRWYPHTRWIVLPDNPCPDIGQTKPAAQRLGLSALSGVDEFSQMAIALLPDHFPLLYLEGFARARQRVIASYPRPPRTLVSANGWYFHESLKFLAMETVAQGGELIALQHGGGYGCAKAMPFEDHEKRIARRFYGWGWAKHNLPQPKLSRPLPASQRKRAILLVSTDHPRYLYRFQSFPVGSQFSEYFLWQERFIAALSDPLRSLCVVRLYPVDYGRGIQQRLVERFPDLSLDRRCSIETSLAQCRLLVLDHCMTTVLESLAYNIPALFFWHPQRWELRPQAEPFYERLRQVGILWDTPESCAVKVAQVYDDLASWWNSAPIQETRRLFVERFAQTSRHGLADWQRMLRQ